MSFHDAVTDHHDLLLVCSTDHDGISYHPMVDPFNRIIIIIMDHQGNGIQWWYDCCTTISSTIFSILVVTTTRYSFHLSVSFTKS